MSKRPQPPEPSRAEAIPTRSSRPLGERSTDAPLPPGVRRRVPPDPAEPVSGRRLNDTADDIIANPPGGGTVAGSGVFGTETTFTSGEATMMNSPTSTAKVRDPEVGDGTASATEADTDGAASGSTEAIGPPAMPRLRPDEFSAAPQQVRPGKHPRFSPFDLLPGRWAFLVVALLHVAAAAFAIVWFS